MPISKEDDKSSWEQYHIILLSQIVIYWIWSLLDSSESLLVTVVSPPIFGLQHCCRFRKRMQLNMGGLWWKTLFSITFSIIFFFTSFSFSSISLSSAVYLSAFSMLSLSIFSFNVCWSFLACLGVINFNFISCPSCLKYISKEDDKCSWEQYHIILISHIVLYWIWSLLDQDESLLVTWVPPPIFGL